MGDAGERISSCSYERLRAEGHDLFVEKLFQLFTADVVLVYWRGSTSVDAIKTSESND